MNVVDRMQVDQLLAEIAGQAVSDGMRTAMPLTAARLDQLVTEIHEILDRSMSEVPA